MWLLSLACIGIGILCVNWKYHRLYTLTKRAVQAVRLLENITLCVRILCVYTLTFFCVCLDVFVGGICAETHLVVTPSRVCWTCNVCCGRLRHYMNCQSAKTVNNIYVGSVHRMYYIHCATAFRWDFNIKMFKVKVRSHLNDINSHTGGMTRFCRTQNSPLIDAELLRMRVSLGCWIFISLCRLVADARLHRNAKCVYTALSVYDGNEICYSRLDAHAFGPVIFCRVCVRHACRWCYLFTKNARTRRFSFVRWFVLYIMCVIYMFSLRRVQISFKL